MVYFNKQIDLYSEALELDPNDPNISASLAGVYSFLGDTEKAFQIFDRIQRKEPISESKAPKVASLSYYNQLKYDPLFENMRKESSFQEYLKTYENVYNRDHEHFLKWLTEQGKL
jgi:tetratricopeptide (TPR) repeat protein